MSKKNVDPEEREFNKALAKSQKEQYVLRLYVAGLTARSTKAIADIKAACEKYLKDRYELEVIDIYQQPKLARSEQIIATPTLIKKIPQPLRRLIGDMSDKEKFLMGIDLKTKKS